MIRCSNILRKEVNTKDRKEAIFKEKEIEKFSELINNTDPFDPRSVMNPKQER